MDLVLETPVKLRVLPSSDSELESLRFFLTFVDKNIESQIWRMKKNPYLINKYGERWFNKKIADLENQKYMCLLYEDEDGYYTLSGLKTKLINKFKTNYKSEVEYPEFKPLQYWRQEPEHEPRPFQIESCNNLLSNPHSHIEVGTGLGKSYIIQLLCKKSNLPTIITTPSRGLAKTIYNDMKKAFGKKKVGMLGGGRKDFGQQFLVCVSKSLSMVDEENYEDFKKYKALIFDESHTSGAKQASSFINNLLAHCPYRWFLSATQERNDGKDLLLEGIIGDRVYEMSVADGQKAGYLAKLNTLIIDVNSNVNYKSDNPIKMNQTHLYYNEKIARFIAECAQKAVKNKIPTLILVSEHKQEEILSEYLNCDYVYAKGGTDTDKICNDFNNGKHMLVVGTSAVSTGTNFKRLKLTFNWQGNKAGTKVKQGAIGRSTRTDKDKDSAKIIDFRITNVPMLKKHADERIKYYRQVGEVNFTRLPDAIT